MAPNALAVAQECSWFLVPVHVFGAMRWTCWNTVRAGGGGGIFGGDGGGEVENRTTDDGGCPGLPCRAHHLAVSTGELPFECLGLI